MDFLPRRPLVDLAILVGIDPHPRLDAFHPRSRADVILARLVDQVESPLGEANIGVGMAATEASAKGERFVDIRGGEPCDLHVLLTCSARRFEVGKEVILPTDRNRRPIAIGVLFGFVDFILGHIYREVFGILFGPMRMVVLGHFAGRLGALIDGRLQEFEIAKTIRADGVAGQRRIPRMLGGIDGAPVLGDHVELPIQIPNDCAIRAVGRIFENEPHVLAGLSVREVLVDIQVGVLVVWEIIIKVGLPIDELSGRHPS